MDSAIGSGDLEAVREALGRHDWAAAHALAVAGAADLEQAEGRSTDHDVVLGDWLDALAEAAWWLGRLDECIAARERAHACYDRAGATLPAGRCAVALFHHWCFKGKQAIASGWLGRARRALQAQPESPEYGYLLLYEAEVAHGAGDLTGATDLVEQALELGRRLRVPDLESQALQALGRLLIDDGRSAEGLARLDEAMLFAIEGRLSPFVTGRVYCSLVSACHELGDIRRANEWIEAVASWAESHPFTVFPGLCRLHRADLMQWRGDWQAAEAEARRACSELDDMYVANAAAAHAGVGEICRRRGDLDAAEDAFARAEALDARPAAGLALLRLAQGRVEAASAVISAAIEETTWNRLARGWLLPVEVQVAVALGDVDRARRAAAELTETARLFESPVLRAAGAAATGRVELAAGDARAGASLRVAVRRWVELDAPYEVATTRVVLARACRAAGDEEGAEASLAAAASVFARLGAALDMREVEALRAARIPERLPCGLTVREAEVLRLVATGLTNKQIGAELSLSGKTITRHLSNIFAKIGVSSRAGATAFAFEHRLAGG
ncbi:MAG TPA: helix-turn-helix transcriptional regulator [Acidimicrobiales bacterium]|nr:helix-turn-helix transcriptional regulator [Acidimicrobiales bacterium]